MAAALVGCATQQEVSALKVRTVKLEVEMDKNREVDHQQNGLLADQDKDIQALKKGMSGRDQLGGGPIQHLPTNIGGIPVVLGRFAYDRQLGTPVFVPDYRSPPSPSPTVQPPAAEEPPVTPPVSSSPSPPKVVPSMEDLKRLIAEAFERRGDVAQGTSEDLTPFFQELVPTPMGVDSQQAQFNANLRRMFTQALKAHAAFRGYHVQNSYPPAYVIREVPYNQYVFYGSRYRVWWHQGGGVAYYQHYPYAWHP
jgi:hypothetical protein